MCRGAMYPAASINAKFFDMEMILSFCKDAKFLFAGKGNTVSGKSRKFKISNSIYNPTEK
jgi:hypothetical protein